MRQRVRLRVVQCRLVFILRVVRVNELGWSLGLMLRGLSGLLFWAGLGWGWVLVEGV